jgi:hypothetical protein
MVPSSQLTPAQVTTLERVLKAGFRFVTLPRIERYLGVEKEGFIALLNTSDNQVTQFGQPGYRLGEGIGMLVERGGQKLFVWKGQSAVATPELLAAYDRFRAEVKALLQP